MDQKIGEQSRQSLSSAQDQYKLDLNSAQDQYRLGLNYAHADQGELYENLQNAIVCYQKALQYYTSETFPDQCRQIQQDMVAAYSHLVQERMKQTQELPPLPRTVRKKRFRILRVCLLGLVSLVILALPSSVIAVISRTNSGPACVNGTLNLDGSTALQPLIEAAAASFMKRCPGSSITVGGGASKTGLDDVEQGHDVITGISQGKDPRHIQNTDVSIDIGDSDIFASPVQSDLVDHQVAIGVFVMILNRSVTNLRNLSTSQIQGIYTGGYSNWQQICDSGPCGPDQAIVPISRTINSGTRFTFEKYVLQGLATVPGIGLNRTKSSGNAVQEVEQNVGSISYAPLYLADSDPNIIELSIDHQNPHDSSFIEHDTYKFWNIEHMYTHGQGSPLAQSFINYVLSEAVSSQLAHFGFLNINDIPQGVLEQHVREGQ